MESPQIIIVKIRIIEEIDNCYRLLLNQTVTAEYCAELLDRPVHALEFKRDGLLTILSRPLITN